MFYMRNVSGILRVSYLGRHLLPQVRGLAGNGFTYAIQRFWSLCRNSASCNTALVSQPVHRSQICGLADTLMVEPQVSMCGLPPQYHISPHATRLLVSANGNEPIRWQLDV
jgi:hypothetical protein